MSSTVAATNAVATSGASGVRLLDLDGRKRVLLKKLLVFGPPGSGIDVVADGLKKLGFKVYDAAEAAKHFERDIPLWLEAAKLKKTDKAYKGYDFDKLIGEYDAIVGGPANFFVEELLKAFSYAKVIMVTHTPEFTIAMKFRGYLALSYVDQEIFGKLSPFLALANESLDQEKIRTAVREKNLLEIDSQLESWKSICEFLEKSPILSDPIPEIDEALIFTLLAAHGARVLSDVAKKLALFLIYCSMASATAVAGFLFGYSIADYNIGPSFLMSLSVLGLFVAYLVVGPKTLKKPEGQPEPESEPKPKPVVEAIPAQKPAGPVAPARPVAQQNPRTNQQRDSRRNFNYNSNNGRNNNGRNNNRQYNRQQQQQRQQQVRGRQNQHNRTQSTPVVAAPRSVLPAPRPAIAGGWSNFKQTINGNDHVLHHEALAHAQATRGNALDLQTRMVLRGQS